MFSVDPLSLLERPIEDQQLAIAAYQAALRDVEARG
jgi:hypothetical protein